LVPARSVVTRLKRRKRLLKRVKGFRGSLHQQAVDSAGIVKGDRAEITEGDPRLDGGGHEEGLEARLCFPVEARVLGLKGKWSAFS
jgi:hypothetical protein